MRKPVYAICEQQRRRSACASAQSIQCLCCSLPSKIPLVSIFEMSSLCLASASAHAGLCLTWSQTPKTGFLVTRLTWSEDRNLKQSFNYVKSDQIGKLVPELFDEFNIFEEFGSRTSTAFLHTIQEDFVASRQPGWKKLTPWLTASPIIC